MAADVEKLSTSALAKRLDIPGQQLFATLKDYGWIERVSDSWVLSAKGEFEGGSYQTSRRYGRYIVWPESLERHPLLAAIESNQRITASNMRRYYPRLHARQINRALAEIGLQRHSILGWELTALGRQLGGQQAESENSGAFYVTWPHEVIDHPVVHRELTRQSDQLQPPEAPQPAGEPDLFSPAHGESSLNYRGVDGHELKNTLELRVCNWLYMAQVVHAYQRALPVEEELVADFYLPDGTVYIDCWESEVPAADLKDKLRKRELYREMDLRNLEINFADIDRLDEVLGRGLLAYGIRC
ncbi:MAG: hypothetical protein AAGI11_20425 [Pseudomonadota bacterium]